MNDTGSLPSPARRWLRLLPVGLFFLALAIRLIGIGWGLKNDLHNQSYHPDETVIWAFSQQIEPAKGHFTPGFYNYGTLYLTVLRVASDVTAAYTGVPNPQNPDSLWSFVARANMAGRLISAFAGAGTVLAVFLMLRRRVGPLASTMGALVIAFAPAHVIHSRFQTVDILAVFFLSLSALFALRILDREENVSALKDAALAGLFAGLSAGTKYTGILALLTLLTVLAITRRRSFLKEGGVGVAVALFSFLLVTPGALLESEKFRKDFVYEMAHTATGHGIVFVGTGSGFVYHMTNLWLGVGILLTLLGLGGLAWGAFRKQVWIFALLAFFVPYYLLIGRAEVKFLRYTFPLYIGLAAGLAVLIEEGHRRKGLGRGLVVLGILGLGGIDSRGLVGTVQATTLMVEEDPRDQAVRWLRKEAKTNESVGLVEDPWFWNPPLFPDATSMRPPASRRLQFFETMRATSRPTADVVVDENGGTIPFDPRLVTERRPDYITYSSLEFDARERLVGRTDVPQEFQVEATRYRDFMKNLSESYENQPIQFGTLSRTVEDMEYINPVVFVWKKKPTP